LALSSSDLACLGTLTWEREEMKVIGGPGWAGLNKNEIAPILVWMDLRIEQLKKKRDKK